MALKVDDGFNPIGILVRIAINAVGLWVAAAVIDGITIGDTAALIVAAVIFGVVNAILGPIAKFFSFCLILLTFGLFTFVINAILLMVTAAISGGLGFDFEVNGFIAAFLGAIIISLVSIVASRVVKVG